MANDRVSSGAITDALIIMAAAMTMPRTLGLAGRGNRIHRQPGRAPTPPRARGPQTSLRAAVLWPRDRL
jgi:hypothetical protein